MRVIRVAGWLVVLVMVGVLFTPSLMADDKKKGSEKPKITIDKAGIYYGDPTDFEKPAVVDVDEIYMSIPEYQEIVDEDLDRSKPKYLMLMRAASKKFRTALKKAAKAKGYDLIGGLGSIKIKGKKVPEITDLVISKLPD